MLLAAMRKQKDRPKEPGWHFAAPMAPDGVYRIAVAGAGGNGSQMISKLVRIDRALRAKNKGRIHVELFDPEYVTLANVARALFFPEEIGKPKARELISRANRAWGVNWESRIEKFVGQTCTQAISKGGYVGSYDTRFDILVCCVDSGAARVEIWEALKESDLPPHYWLDIGNEAAFGQAVLGEIPSVASGNLDDPDRLPVLIEREPEFYDGTIPESNLPSCSLSESLDRQSLFIHDEVTVPAGDILWELLREGKTEKIGAFRNLADYRSNPLRVPIAPALEEAA